MFSARSVVSLALTVLVSACATPTSVTGPNAEGVMIVSPADSVEQKAVADAAAQARPFERRTVPTGIRVARKVDMYLRVQPDATGLINALDDGRFTYIVFRNRTPDGVGIFDPDGKTISFVKSGSVVAFAGLHPGILVRTAFGYSFIAPNPRATAADRPEFDDDPEVAEARSRLEGELSQMEAMRKAISRVERRGPDASLDNAAGSAGGESGANASRRGTEEQPVLERRPNGETLIRIFFTDGKVALAKPDEGMQKLAKEARGASEALVMTYPEPPQGKDGKGGNGAAITSARTDMVKSMLLKNGIPASKISISTSPDSQNITDGITASGKPLKRRVEVILRGKKG
jgi:hypothetical protein